MRGISDPVIAIQKMLYDHPIYESLKFGNTEPKILVIGSGTYGHIFIDQCLQAGQIKGYKLHITSISDKADKDKERYLQFRPELTRFVNVNGSIEKSRHDCMYADLVFRDLKDNDDTVRFTVIQDGASDALKGTDSAISDIPEYQKDYEALWQIYESDKNAWRALCSCIDEYELRNKPLAQFEILGNECNEYTEKLSFVLPEYTEKTVRRLLRELSERDILRDDIIENYTSESYIVKFSVSKKYRHAFDTLFADPRILLDYYGVRAYNESKYVRVGYNNLEVVDISRIEENSYRMLEKLQDKHFINGLRREDSSDKVSFAFTSPRIKRVMMKTNRVLLLRAYYETLKYGYHEPNRIAYFDDVVYGSKIGNQDESDALFITKGFRHIKITDMGEWSDEQLACIGDTLNEKLRENNQ